MRTPCEKSVAVIGAGIGGMTTALLLSHQGYKVTVYEKMPAAGGKMRQFRFADCTFDAGPSLITMPFILRDLFNTLDRSLEEYIDLIPIEPLCRYFWSDDSQFDAYADPEKHAKEIARFSPDSAHHIQRYLDHAGQVYHATKDIFLFNKFEGIKEFFKRKNLPFLPLFPKLRTLTTLHNFHTKKFTDKRLIQLFDRFATYNGSNPYKAPATLMVIPFIEFYYGGWYPRGGIYAIAQAFTKLCAEYTIPIHYSTAVTTITTHNNSVQSLTLDNGETISYDYIVSNADAYWTQKYLLGEKPSIPELSSSGFVIMAAVRKKPHTLAHHNIFFSNNYEKEFHDIFEKKIAADDMTIYISISSLTDSSQASDDRENWFILVNTPADGGNNTWHYIAEEYWNKIQKKLHDFGVELYDEDIIEKKIITPDNFANDINATGGSLYGGSSNSPFSAFLRPQNSSKKYDNLFYVGGTVHPGGGIPLVILSGMICAKELDAINHR